MFHVKREVTDCRRRKKRTFAVIIIVVVSRETVSVTLNCSLSLVSRETSEERPLCRNSNVTREFPRGVRHFPKHSKRCAVANAALILKS